MHQNYHLYHHHHQRPQTDVETASSRSSLFLDQQQQRQQQQQQHQQQQQALHQRQELSHHGGNGSSSSGGGGSSSSSSNSSSKLLSPGGRLAPLHRFDTPPEFSHRYGGAAQPRHQPERLSLIRQGPGEQEAPSYRHHQRDHKDREMHSSLGSASNSSTNTSNSAHAHNNAHAHAHAHPAHASSATFSVYSSSFRPLTHAGTTSAANSQSLSIPPNRANSSSPPTSSLSTTSTSTIATTPGSQATATPSFKAFAAKNEERRGSNGGGSGVGGGSSSGGSFSASYRNPHQQAPATAPARVKDSIEAQQQQDQQASYRQQEHEQEQSHHLHQSRTAPAAMLTHESSMRSSASAVQDNDRNEAATADEHRWDEVNGTGGRSSPQEAGEASMQRDPQSDEEIDFESDDDDEVQSEKRPASLDGQEAAGSKRKAPYTSSVDGGEPRQDSNSGNISMPPAPSSSTTASAQPPRLPSSSNFPPLRKSCDRCFKMKTKCSRAAPGATGDGPCVGCVKRGHKDSCITSRPDAPFPRASSTANKRVRRDVQSGADPASAPHLLKSSGSSGSLPMRHPRETADGELESAATPSSSSAGRAESSHDPKRAYERFYSPESPDLETRRPDAALLLRNTAAVRNVMPIESLTYDNSSGSPHHRLQHDAARPAFGHGGFRGSSSHTGHVPVKARAMPTASAKVPTAAQLRTLTTTELRDIGLHVMSEVARRANTLAAESQQHIRQEQYMHQAMPSSNIVHQQANLASHKLPQQISRIFLSNFERHVWPLLSVPHLSPARLRATPPEDENVVSSALTDIALAIGIQLHASSLTASQTANSAQGKIYRACFESDDTRRQQQDRQAEDVKVWLDDEQCRAYAVNMVRSRGSKIGEKSCDSVLEDLLLFHFYSIRGEHCAASDCAARARRAVLRLQDSWRGEAGWTENEARYLWRRVEDADWQSPGSLATGPYPSQPAGEPLVQLDGSPSWTVDDAFHALSHLLSRSLTPGDMPNDLLLSRFRASIPESLAFSLKNDWMDKDEAGATGWINETSVDRSQPSLKVSMCLGVCFARLLTAIKPLVDGYKGDGMTGEEPRRCYETASAMTSATILALDLFPDIAAEALRYAHHSVAAAWSMAVASKRISSEVGSVLGKQVQDVRQLADLLDSVSGTKECRFATLMRQAADFMEDTLEVDLEELAKQGKLRRLMLGDTTVSVPTVNPAGNPVDASTAKAEPTSR